MDSPTFTTGRVAPLGEIALGLSGGGYRAAAYHLGLLDLLQRLDLLRDVTSLSTVSAGTISGASYATALAAFNAVHFPPSADDAARPPTADDDYEMFRASPRGYRQWYESLYQFLDQVNVVEESLVVLDKRLGTASGRTPKLIAAAAEIYEQRLLPGATMGTLLADPRMHLREITFNATDFRAGLGFRFQKTATKGISGSYVHRIPPDVLKQIRLADVVAASSCFPAAFEPLGFPDDFAWDDLEQSRKELNEGHATAPFDRPIPLMDGGIADNQGIESLLNVFGRKNATLPGLVFISDTDIYDYELYRFPKPAEGWVHWLTSWFTVGEALRIGTFLVMFFLAWAAWLAGSTADMFSPWMYASCIATPLLLWSILAVLPLAGWDLTIGEAQRGVDGVVRGHPIDVEAWVSQFNLTQLGESFALRTGSLLSLATGVYLKQIRSRVYDHLFSHPKLKGSISVSLIHELRKKSPQAAAEQWPQISPALLAVVDRAAKMPTTLWFSPGEEPAIRDVVACGQISALYNLIEHLDKLRELGASPDERKLRERLDALLFEVRIAPTGLSLAPELLAELAAVRDQLAQISLARRRWSAVNDGLYPRALALWAQLLADPYALVDRPFDSTDAEFLSGEEIEYPELDLVRRAA